MAKTAAKKVVVKKTKQEAKEPAGLVFDRWRKGSINGNIYEVLSDGKAHALAPFAKACGAGSIKNFEHAKIPKIKKVGKETGAFDIVKQDGAYKMIFTSGKKPLAPAATKPKPAAAAAKPNGTPARKPPAKKQAKPKEVEPEEEEIDLDPVIAVEEEDTDGLEDLPTID